MLTLGSSQIYLVYITVKDQEEGLSIAKQVLEKKLVACANLHPNIRSAFLYKGQMQIEDESVLILKTTALKYDELEKFVLAIHSYENPCVLKLPVHSGSEAFTKWIERNVISE